MFVDYSLHDIAALAAMLPAVYRGQGLDTSNPTSPKYANCSS